MVLRAQLKALQADAIEVNLEPEVWTGEGKYFPSLEVRNLGSNLYRVNATSNPPSPYTDYSTIIEAQSIEEAIGHLQNYDWSYFDEATLYCEEG